MPVTLTGNGPVPRKVKAVEAVTARMDQQLADHSWPVRPAARREVQADRKVVPHPAVAQERWRVA
jgi:hypothetical protein